MQKLTTHVYQIIKTSIFNTVFLTISFITFNTTNSFQLNVYLTKTIIIVIISLESSYYVFIAYRPKNRFLTWWWLQPYLSLCVAFHSVTFILWIYWSYAIYSPANKGERNREKQSRHSMLRFVVSECAKPRCRAVVESRIFRPVQIVISKKIGIEYFRFLLFLYSLVVLHYTFHEIAYRNVRWSIKVETRRRDVESFVYQLVKWNEKS